MEAEALEVSPEAGFTLVEMLVSLALASLVALLMIFTLQATSVVSLSVRHLAAQDDVQLVRAHLRRLLSDRAGRRIGGRPSPFLGLPDRLVITIQADRDTIRGAEMSLDLRTVPAGHGLDLVESGGPAEVQGRPELLLGGVDGLLLRYFGAQGSDPAPRWMPTWTRKDRPPTLVEVTVTFPRSDSRLWPPLVLAVGNGT